MSLRFSTTDRAAFNGCKVLTYGPAGVGKTVLCATAPAPVILSAEAGLLSLRRVSIPVLEIHSLEDLSEAYGWCLYSREAQQFQTVCLDSITEIGEVVLAKAKHGVKDPRQAYGELLDRMSQLVRSFRDMPSKHVYFSAKEESFKEDVTGVVKYGPSMPGSKLGPLLPYFFDEVFRLGIGKAQDGSSYRFLQTQPDFQYVAKDRSGSLAAVEQPDLGSIFNKIQTQ